MSDFTTMITDVINWTNHDEITTANAESLVRYAEKRIYRECKVRAMEATLSLTISGGAAALPADFIALKSVRITGSPDQPLEIIDDEQMYRRYPIRSSDSKPLTVAVEAENLIFGPYPDSGYTIRGIYYRRLTALSGANTTNFFTGDGADALFFTALAEAEPFLRNDPRVQLWEAKAGRAIRDINKEYMKGRFAGPLRSKEA